MNELNEDKILNNISIMIEAANEIREDNEILGDIFLANLKNSMQIAQALETSTELDISEKIELMSGLLGLSLEEIVLNIIDKNQNDCACTEQESVEFIMNNSNLENSEQESVDFIINNSDIDDYEKFLKENSILNNIKELKGVL